LTGLTGIQQSKDKTGANTLTESLGGLIYPEDFPEHLNEGYTGGN
jgi:hypothetical protein